MSQSRLCFLRTSHVISEVKSQSDIVSITDFVRTISVAITQYPGLWEVFCPSHLKVYRMEQTRRSGIPNPSLYHYDLKWYVTMDSEIENPTILYWDVHGT